ncbi:protein disulfide-isomerase TMX3 [Elysia marginata]|uniref:Protein disulfide-isomerase TMX3 n=1 Tax=Elysia marginata TaxID=1093978 RepID=A0AAV4H8P6_9GAST|nr:protein disulfide-isomerase TMX3 [Elysia marginata]
MDELETVSSIAMTFLGSPSLMALRTSDHLYYMPEAISNITVPQLAAFLNRVAAGEETAYGGTSFFMRVRRLLFDIVSTILSIWQASRWLFLLMFGLPTVIISIICYSLCCMEAIDDGPADSDEEDEDEDGEGGQGHLYDAPPPALTRSGPPPSYDSVTSADAGPKDVDEKKKD